MQGHLRGPTSCLRQSIQSRDARQLRGTSYDGSISVTDGARSASTPLPSRHCVGMTSGFETKLDQSAEGTAAPTHERTVVPPAKPVAADASARIPGRRRSRNSPMPPRITPTWLR